MFENISINMSVDWDLRKMNHGDASLIATLNIFYFIFKFKNNRLSLF